MEGMTGEACFMHPRPHHHVPQLWLQHLPHIWKCCQPGLGAGQGVDFQFRISSGERGSKGQWDVSVAEGACCQVWQSEVDPRDPQMEGKQKNYSSQKLFSDCHMCAMTPAPTPTPCLSPTWDWDCMYVLSTWLNCALVLVVS